MEYGHIVTLMINEQNNFKTEWDDYLIYDISQIKEYGKSFMIGDGYTARYVKYKKLFLFNILYFPYAPIAKDLTAFENFLKDIEKQKLTKYIIELPKIDIQKDLDLIKNMLLKYGYKPTKYTQDSETLVLNKSNYSLSSKDQRYIRNALKEYDCEIIMNPNDQVIESVYEIYHKMGTERFFNIKPINSFMSLPNKVISIVKKRSTGEIHGFLLGSIINRHNVPTFYCLFTALTHEGFENKLGYMTHKYLFDYVFDNNLVTQVDFHGADRKKRTYVEFKSRFGGSFVPYAGSYSKINIL